MELLVKIVATQRDVENLKALTAVVSGDKAGGLAYSGIPVIAAESMVPGYCVGIFEEIVTGKHRVQLFKTRGAK